jgi:predicted RNA binding protein YcfA (HicA-like mRNA interferase family)
MIPPHMLQQLRNTPVRELIGALEQDGFIYRRLRGSGRVYRHPDGRRVVIHYHHSGDTLTLGTLRNILGGARWTENDLRRLDLIS